MEIPKLGNVVVHGVLEFSENNTEEIVLEANHILVTGWLIAGPDESHPYPASLIIRLRGQRNDPVFPMNGATVGSKFIGLNCELNGLYTFSLSF